MKFITLITLAFVFVVNSLSAQAAHDKYKESENVRNIKSQVYVFDNGQNHFWTSMGVEKGKEYLDELLFLEAGDEIVYFMTDQKKSFQATFSSEDGAIFDGLPKQQGDYFELRGTHKIEATGDYKWRFTTLEKEGFLYNPSLNVILAKSGWAKYKNAAGLKNQIEFLIAMSANDFIPIQGEFIEKDVKETRHKSSYVFQDSVGEILNMARGKGTICRVKMYVGTDEAKAKQVKEKYEQEINKVLPDNCLSGPKVDTKPPYSLYTAYYKSTFTGCGDEKTQVSIAHYLFRGKYYVEIEVFHASK
jgi:hypothetical protein